MNWQAYDPKTGGYKGVHLQRHRRIKGKLIALFRTPCGKEITSAWKPTDRSITCGKCEEFGMI